MNGAALAMLAARRAKRIVQTPRAFSNWATVLADLGREPLGVGPQTLEFATRSGLRISSPNRPGARVPIYEVFAEDTYRLDWFLGALMHRPIGVLDIGAHVGTFACDLAQRHRTATIHSFEPSPTTAEYLRRNVARNGFAGRIRVSELALADKEGTGVFEDNRAGSGMNGLVSAGHRDDETITVVTTTFDNAMSERTEPVDLVKIDTEGGEYGLVYASSPKSWAGVSRVVLEYHNVAGQSWDDLRRWFAEAGLRVERDDPVGDGLGTAWLSRERLS